MAVEEGFAARRARTAKQAESVHPAAKALGIELFPEVDANSYYSNTVTAMILNSALLIKLRAATPP